jgi:hypothetical protein
VLGKVRPLGIKRIVRKHLRIYLSSPHHLTTIASVRLPRKRRRPALPAAVVESEKVSFVSQLNKSDSQLRRQNGPGSRHARNVTVRTTVGFKLSSDGGDSGDS